MYTDDHKHPQIVYDIILLLQDVSLSIYVLHRTPQEAVSKNSSTTTLAYHQQQYEAYYHKALY